MEIKSGNIPKEISIESQNSTNISESVKKLEDKIEDLNASYSDTSSDGGGLSSPPLGMINVQRRRCYVKGQGWTSIFIHPKPKVDKIIELIGEIQDK